MTDDIPTGDPTTVPMSELEGLIQDVHEKDWGKYNHPRDGAYIVAGMVNDLIDEYDPNTDD